MSTVYGQLREPADTLSPCERLLPAKLTQQAPFGNQKPTSRSAACTWRGVAPSPTNREADTATKVAKGSCNPDPNCPCNPTPSQCLHDVVHVVPRRTLLKIVSSTGHKNPAQRFGATSVKGERYVLHLQRSCWACAPGAMNLFVGRGASTHVASASARCVMEFRTTDCGICGRRCPRKEIFADLTMQSKEPM